MIGSPPHCTSCALCAHASPALCCLMCRRSARAAERGPRWLLRMLAVKKFFWCHGDAVAAARMLHAEDTSAAAWHAGDVQRWAERFQETGTLEDAPRSGRPSVVPRQEVLECAEVMRAGVVDDGGVHHHWRNIDDDAGADSIFDMVCNSYGVTRKQLFAAMREYDQELHRRRQEVKWLFSPIERRVRKYLATWNLEQQELCPAFKDTIVFLDEASAHLNDQTGAFVWCGKHGDSRCCKLTPLHASPM